MSLHKATHRDGANSYEVTHRRLERSGADMSDERQVAPGPSILVVDDNDEVRAVIVRNLLRAGYRVTQAASSSAAMAVLEDQVPDLVITDIFMPEGDGLEIINEIRRCALSVPIIVISGGGAAIAADYLGVASRLGATSVLSKPFKGQQLLDAVHLALHDATSNAA
jgi:CheY-like chemotaxis protein